MIYEKSTSHPVTRLIRFVQLFRILRRYGPLCGGPLHVGEGREDIQRALQSRRRVRAPPETSQSNEELEHAVQMLAPQRPENRQRTMAAVAVCRIALVPTCRERCLPGRDPDACMLRRLPQRLFAIGQCTRRRATAGLSLEQTVHGIASDCGPAHLSSSIRTHVTGQRSACTGELARWRRSPRQPGSPRYPCSSHYPGSKGATPEPHACCRSLHTQ